MTHPKPAALLGTFVLALTLMAAACGSDNSAPSAGTTGAPTVTTAATATTATTTGGAASSSSSAGTGSAQLCADRDASKSSVQALTSVDVVKNGTSGIQTALTKVKDDLAALKTSATADLQPEITALEDALSSLESAIKDTGSGGVAPIVTAAKDVAQTGSTLLTSLGSAKC